MAAERAAEGARAAAGPAQHQLWGAPIPLEGEREGYSMGNGGQALRLVLLEALREAERDGGEDRRAGLYRVGEHQLWRSEALLRVGAEHFGRRACLVPSGRGAHSPTRFDTTLRSMVHDGVLISGVYFLPRHRPTDPESPVRWGSTPARDVEHVTDYKLNLYRLPTLAEARDAWLDRASHEAMRRRMRDGGKVPAAGWERWRLGWAQTHHANRSREAFLRHWRATRGVR